jgi:hypothetical protein
MYVHHTLLLTVLDCAFSAAKLGSRKEMMKHFVIYFFPVLQSARDKKISSLNDSRNSPY